MDNTTAEKKRGALLTIWLILMLIANIYTAYIFFLVPGVITDSFPDAPSWITYALGILSLLNIIFVIFLFKWKKWAFYGFLVVVGVAFVINIIIKVNILYNLAGFLGPIILYLIMRPKWDLFGTDTTIVPPASKAMPVNNPPKNNKTLPEQKPTQNNKTLPEQKPTQNKKPNLAQPSNQISKKKL